MKNKIQPPQFAEAVLDRLLFKGCDAFFVGGCVRDSLMGRIPQDWDITTAATPEQVISCFEGYHVIPTGLKHGTVTIVVEGEPVEVTTYRVDGAYSDHRRPDSVFFTASLQEDLARRDFTINAMAWNPQAGLQDFFGGKQDLQDGVVRCVGDASTRFQEDALRILRGARFACVLGFAIEAETAMAMTALCGLLTEVSAERIAAELVKALSGPRFGTIFSQHPELLTQIIPEMEPCVGFAQHNPAHTKDVYGHILQAVDAGQGEVVRLTLLLHDIEKPSCFSMDSSGVGHFYGHGSRSADTAAQVLTRLRFPQATINRVQTLIARHDAVISPEQKAVRRWLRRLGEEPFRQLLEVQAADNVAKSPEFQQQNLDHVDQVRAVLEEVLAEEQCYSLRDLAVKGEDLAAAGVPRGPEMGKLLQKLLDLVVEGEVPNTREALLAILEKQEFPNS